MIPQAQLRKEAHQVSFRPALVQGKKSGELFVTLNTRNCFWGRCLFCGLGKIDGNKPPLSGKEAVEQLRGSIRSFEERGGDLKRVGKISLITNSDSVLNPSTVSASALLGILHLIRETLPAVEAIDFESRVELVRPGVLLALSRQLDGVFGETRIARGVTVGIESPYAKVRGAIHKGLSDSKLFQAARMTLRAGFGLRGYFIYNLLEPDGVGRVQNLVDAIELMSRMDYGYKSILVLRGYVPERLAATPLFRSFAEVPDGLALSELSQAAAHAKSRGVRFEIDSTTADQENTASLTAMNPAYIAAVIRYNTTLDPQQLRC